MLRHSLQKARHAASVQPIRLFSFDVFDTFLYRRCTGPDGVFERAFNLGPLASRFPDSIENFVQHRIQAEAKARRRNKETSGSTEVTVAEIYEHFPFRLFALDRARLHDLADAEFKAELDLCFANPDIRLLFEEFRASGMRAGFISDTYWTAAQLSELLRASAPGLVWDFLYASCDHRTGKRGDLFRRYLAEQRVNADQGVHIGDNAEADVKGARDHGLRALHYPQAGAHFSGVLQRESTAHGLFCANRASRRLDSGLGTMRRVVAGHLPDPSPAFALGATVIGPVMAAFDRFVADRVDKLTRSGGNVAVAFLARDGRLSFDVWGSRHPRPAYYVEVNRRCALVASAATTDPLVDLFGKIHRIDAAVVADILKYDSQCLRAFFAQHPGGIASGEALAKALPDLIGREELAAVAGNLRRELMIYLRRTIPGFDDISDLVVVDLGYSGSVQKALRHAFDCEGIGARLHGLYLLTVDEAFEELAANDTAEGFISDLVVTPHVNRMFMRNVAILEQLCCSPDGTVSGYRDGEVLREPDRRTERQIALAGSAQSGALHFAERAAAMEETHGLQPFDDLPAVAARAAAMLGRLLVLPTDDDIVLLGGLEHDVNLGTRAMVTMADPRAVDALGIAAALPTVCTANAPPMWMGASMAGLSPALGYLYAQHGAGGLPGDVFSDVPCGRLDIGLVLPTETRQVRVTCVRTGFADIRLRIPLRSEWNTQALAIPIDQIAPEGLVQGVAIQTGSTVNSAMQSPDVRRIAIEHLHGAGIEMIGRHYRPLAAATRHLVVPVPSFTDAVAVVSLTLAPLGDARVLALNNDADA